ncbi:hypothetical protein EI94DRAFT_1710150 [Lactarius quietus]|nr:hypothetical protein EI94DRAFT_1710150 [Lactarius quietus]
MSSPTFQLILDALDNYTEETGINLKENPFADKVKGCDSPGAILRLLEENVKAFKKYRDKNRKFIDCLSPVVQFVHTFSGILGEAAGLVPFQPTKLIFVGIDVLFAAAGGVSASYDALLELFECIGSFLKRLDIYAKISLSPVMTEIVVKMMVELVSVLALARKQIKQGRFKQFAKKLLGDTEIESILRRLDRLTQEEARMMDAQILEVVYGLINNMKVVMDGGEASTSAIRKSLVTMQDVLSEINKLNRSIEPAIQATVYKRNLEANFLPQTHPRIKLLRAEIIVMDPPFGSPKVPPSKTGMQRVAFYGYMVNLVSVAGSGKSILCSTVIQEVKAMCDSGLALIAYFYFDFRDTTKQDIRGLLSSVVTQLSVESDACYNILSDLYSAHYAGSQLPDDEALTRCLKNMLQLLDQPPIYLIVDAVDECPGSTGVVSPRERVLGLFESLVESHLPNLRLCITSRYEADIIDVLEPLASHIISLHDEGGQKQDIIDYINAAVYSDRKMRRWRAQDRQSVINALIGKADGMFRWVFCQLEILRRCFPTALRRALDSLPESLDETYERILLSIDKEKQKYSHRLFQCLTVSIRPLRVEELAEILAIQLEDGQDSEYDTEWRPEDAQQAVLSACSSLITIVNVNGFPVVQFAHFSVKEFLTSDRLRHSAAGFFSLPRFPPFRTHHSRASLP